MRIVREGRGRWEGKEKRGRVLEEKNGRREGDWDDEEKRNIGKRERKDIWKGILGGRKVRRTGEERKGR